MTLKRFLVTNLGQKVDYDGAYGAQCVDFFRAYCRDVLNIKQTPSVDGAREIWEKHGEDLKQTKESYAPGDILIYDKTSSNPYGHVCILVSLLDSDNFIVAEQNGFSQKGVELNIRNKTNLLGGLYK